MIVILNGFKYYNFAISDAKISFIFPVFFLHILHYIALLETLQIWFNKWMGDSIVVIKKIEL